MLGGAHGDHQVFAPGDLDDLAPRRQRLVLRADPVGVALDLLQVEVADIRPQVGEAPGDVGVVADHHPRVPAEGVARHLVRAGRRHGRAVQAHLVPDARQRGAEVRVVGQQRLARRGAVAGDDPRVRPDARAARPHQRGHGVECLQHPAQRRHGGDRRRRRGLGHRLGVLVEGPADDRALRDDRLVVGEREVRVEALGPVDPDLRGDQAALDLLLHVAAQVPRHRLEPCDGVGRGPRLDLVPAVGQAEDDVLKGQLAVGLALEVGVDALGVRVERRARLGRQQRQLLLGDPPPAEGADEGVRRRRGLAQHLREPAGGHVPADVHLPEPVLGVHEALGEEQVVAAGRVDLRDAVGVAHHLHLPVEARDG